jgi:hypothetical protein
MSALQLRHRGAFAYDTICGNLLPTPQTRATLNRRANLIQAATSRVLPDQVNHA